MGHSQGTSIILAGMSDKYEYFKEKLLSVTLIAPTTTFSSCEIPYFHLGWQNADAIHDVAAKFNMYEQLS